MMKRNILFASALALVAVSAHAQDQYDLARYTANDLNGTARYIGMGGALGALGADITSMNTNPAGLGIYRSNDISISADLSMLNAGKDLNINGTNRASLNQLGVAWASKYSNYSDLKYINYGFSYRRSSNFFDDFSVANNWEGEFSQTFQMAEMTYGLKTTVDMPILPAVGVGAGTLVKNDDGTYSGSGAYNTDYSSRSTGGIHEYDFSIAFNWNDKYFLGATLGYRHASFDRETWYTEYGSDDCSYDMYNYYSTRGDGMNIKLGGIIRPFDENNFRFGVAVQSPTYFMMTDENGVEINTYDVDGKTNIGSAHSYVDPTDYRFMTPWKFNFNVGTTWENKLAIGAEYELENYHAFKLYDGTEGYENAFTSLVDSNVKNMLKTVHTFKVGAEIKLNPEIAFRAGYNYSTAAFDKGAYRSLIEFTDSPVYVDTFTETSYSNQFDLHRLTCGFGYRTSSFYFDLAYQYTMQKADFFAFDDYYEDGGKTYYLPATEISKDRSRLTMTLGYRF